MTFIDRSFMPAVADENHVLFDTEVGMAGQVTHFFQDTRMTRSMTRRKVFGIDTNMLGCGSMPAGCAKEMTEVRLLSKDLPVGSELSLRFIVGCTPKFDRRVKLGEWVSLEMCGLRLDGNGQTSADKPVPQFFRDGESFAFHVLPIQGVEKFYDLRIEVRGTFWRPAYGTPAHMTWRNRTAAARVESFNGRAMIGDGLFDIDLMRDGQARLFVSTHTLVDGRPKQFGIDTNLVGNGSSLCRGHMKHLTAIEIEPQTEIRGALDVRLLLSGYEWTKATLQKVGDQDRRVLRLPEPVNLLECEHFVVEVSSPFGENATVKATLLGPLFVPGPQPARISEFAVSK